MKTKGSISYLRDTRTHADKIFAGLFVVLTPMLGGIAYAFQAAPAAMGICSASGILPNAAGSWLIASLIAGLVALGSVFICRHRPGEGIGGIYNAIGAMVFSVLFMHFGRGHGEAHFPFFIFTSLLLYYRAIMPIAIACVVIVEHHLSFFALQGLGVPVVAFSSLDRNTLIIHIFAAIGQCSLLAYIAARMKKDDLARIRASTEQQFAASVFHNAIEGIVVTDARGTILSVNPAFTQITGYTADEAIGQTPRLLKSNHHDDAFYAAMWRSVETTGEWKGELWNRRKGGEVFLESQCIRRVHGEEGAIHYVAVFNDITEQWHKDKRIEYLAFHDSLTGLANRSLLGDRLRHAIALGERTGGSLAVLAIDLDRFKNVNDGFGHDKGDALLRVVAARLSAVARDSDTVARVGGDEFVMVLQTPGHPEEIAAIATRIIESIARPVEVDGLSLRVGTSIGIAVYPGDGEEASSLLKNADAAMYEAKADGKSTYRFFSAAMTSRAQARLHLEMDLRSALEKGQLELYYQPKICLHFGMPCGAEVLARWRHPDQGLISPLTFIPLAEETGLIESIGSWVLEEACRNLGRWRASGTMLSSLAVNVSAVQLRHAAFAEKVRDLLQRHGLPGNALEIELTESTVMNDPAQAIESMKAIRALGVRISIDDFGTGYSSLSYLKRLPIDALKIDRSFVMEADRSEDGAVICSTIIGLAKNLNFDVVAEGIETEAQLSYLKKQGCNIGQGYYYSRPLPLAELTRWLAANPSRNCADCVRPSWCDRPFRAGLADVVAIRVHERGSVQANASVTHGATDREHAS